MASAIGRDAEAFARLMLQTVERLGQDDWVRAQTVLEQTIADHPDHPFVAHLEARPGRRLTVMGWVERLRATEFGHIERRKGRHAPVSYRAGPPKIALDLQLPFDAPPSHPLLSQRRAAEAQRERTTSARHAALTERVPNSPWRRRLPRPTEVGHELDVAAHSLRRWWERLRTRLAALAAGPARR